MYTFIEFLNENNLENIITRMDVLLKSIEAIPTLMGDELDFNSEKIVDIESLCKDNDFLKKLNKKNLKKNNIEYSRDCETFLEKTLDLKFFLIFDENDSELSQPKFIVLQSKPIDSYKWNSIKIYKVGGNIRKLYDVLTNKTIEITKNGENYIYKTSNAGNDWALQNIDSKNREFKNVMSNKEIRDTQSRGSKIKEVDHI